MIKAGLKVSWVENTGETRRDPLPGEGLSYIIIPGKDFTVKGKLGDLSNVFLPVETEEGVVMKLYKDLKALQGDRVSCAFKLPDVVRIKKGTHTEETIIGQTIRKTAKIGYLGNVTLPVINDKGVESKALYKDLKMEVK